ncbi:MAG TPA: nucleotide disphospho-sugar-binding domain-containing protein [Gaiellales bacterium]|nr:nucleotide disphospho-sugar-binding domain-containing protein [Gaiellales bacterium]
MSERRTIAFFPEPGAWGPTNNCVAIAEVLKERGHRVVFIVDSSFEGVLEERGYEERMIRMAPAEDAADASEDPWSEFIRVTAPEFRKPTIEQQATVTRPIWETLVAGVRYSHDRMVAIWEDIKPDVVCTDNVTGYPAVELAGCPWVRFVSANPLEMRDPDLPPPLAGLPVDARSEWEAFREEYRRVHADLLEQHNEFRRSVGTEPCPPDEFNINSPFANMYLYPEAIDYTRSRPLDETWHRLESTVRQGDAAWNVDEHLPGEGKIVYLSLGSLGCMDIALMQRLIDALSNSDHRVVVSMGPLKDQMRLGERMAGDQFLPQPSILPQCDLLITHGGNNTLCEGFHFGLPMIGLPLFWDQYDNAQRLSDTGYGARLPTYDWTQDQLLATVDRLIADDALAGRMRANAGRIQASHGRALGAELLERVAAGG